jgi:hypothetical protein
VTPCSPVDTYQYFGGNSSSVFRIKLIMLFNGARELHTACSIYSDAKVVMNCEDLEGGRALSYGKVTPFAWRETDKQQKG